MKAPIFPARVIKVTFSAKITLMNSRLTSSFKGRKSIWTTFIATKGGEICSFQRFPFQPHSLPLTARNSTIGSGKEFTFDVSITRPDQMIYCLVGCDRIGETVHYRVNLQVGCEVDVTCDPGLDTAMFVNNVQKSSRTTIVRNQRTISELLDDALTSTSAQQIGSKAAGSAFVKKGLFFEFISLTLGGFQNTDRRKQRITPRTNDSPNFLSGTSENLGVNFDDSFSEIEIDDTEFDEEDLRKLDRMECTRTDKLPNGNFKCEHSCKDRVKYSPP